MKKTSMKLKLKLITDTLGEPVTVKKIREYPTLYIGDRMVTQGTEEVQARINALVREYGLTFDTE